MLTQKKKKQISMGKLTDSKEKIIQIMYDEKYCLITN